jgi:hypothetical protein
MARQVWAALQPNAKRKLDENKYRFSFKIPTPPTPAEYRAKSMRAYRGQGGRVKAPRKGKK